jgi:hypothetical protein
MLDLGLLSMGLPNPAPIVRPWTPEEDTLLGTAYDFIIGKNLVATRQSRLPPPTIKNEILAKAAVDSQPNHSKPKLF